MGRKPVAKKGEVAAPKGSAKKSATKPAAPKKVAAPKKSESTAIVLPPKLGSPPAPASEAKASKSQKTACKDNAVSYAVTRLLRLKFSHVALTVLATAVNAEGETLESVIGNEVRRTIVGGEYIKASFWSEVEAAFNLQCVDWEHLPEPHASIAETDPYDVELPNIMKLILGDNPAMKSKGLDRLETHLESCERLPLRQVYGLLLESCESSRITRSFSVKFQWMLLRYVAKHNVVCWTSEHPEVIKNHQQNEVPIFSRFLWFRTPPPRNRRTHLDRCRGDRH